MWWRAVPVGPPCVLGSRSSPRGASRVTRAHPALVGQSGRVRYAPAVLAFVLAIAAFLGGAVLLVVALPDSRTGAGSFLGVALGLAGFIVAAWAVGRIRRIRDLTPEAIISPSHETDSQHS